MPGRLNYFATPDVGGGFDLTILGAAVKNIQMSRTLQIL